MTMLGGVYIIQLREFLDKNVYKIGMTTKGWKRFDNYPKGSNLIMYMRVSNPKEIENKIKTKFIAKFTQKTDYGTEYFEGDIDKMIADFCEISQIENNLIETKKKDIVNNIQIPDNYKNILTKKENIDYEYLKEQWEDVNQYGAVKILNPPLIFIKIKGDYVSYTIKGIKEAFKHIKTIDTTENEEKEVSFIQKWLNDKNMKVKYDIVMDPLNKDINSLNLWNGYHIEKINIDNYNFNQEAVDIFKYHLKYCCDFDENVYKLMLKIIAHYFQYPGKKAGLCPILTGECGKDSLMYPIYKLIGNDKYLITEQPENHVWGKFNHLLKTVKLVQLSELEYGNTSNFMNRIKGLITNENIIIKEECKSPFQINSIHNYIILTNNDMPIKLTKGQRRFFIVNCSSKHKNDSEYFNKFYETWDNQNNLLSLYNYLTKLENVPELFKEHDIVFSKYHQLNNMDSDREEIEFLRYYILNLDELKTENILTKNLWLLFNNWRKEMKQSNFDITSIKFGICLNKLAIQYPQSFLNKKKTVNGAMFQINFKQLYKDLECETIENI